MRHRLALVFAALAAATACSIQAPQQTPAPSASATPPADLESATPEPTPTPSASPSASPTPSASPSPSPTPGATQLRELDEAQHGPSPFPSPPSGAAYDLSDAMVAAGGGNTTARGAIDGKPYTEWSARQGVAPNVWYAIDLGSIKKVSRVDLLGDASPSTQVFFDVEVSTDYAAWKRVGAGKAVASNGMKPNGTPEWGSATFAPEQARYVRIVPTSWGTSWVAVWELRVVP